MNILIVGIISVISYTSATTLIVKELIAGEERHRRSIYLAWTGAVLHGIYTAFLFQLHNGFNFSFFNTAALVALFIVLILLFAALDKPVEKLGIAIDQEANDRTLAEVGEIGRSGHSVRVLAVRTNEELQIARETLAVLTD